MQCSGLKKKAKSEQHVILDEMSRMLYGNIAAHTLHNLLFTSCVTAGARTIPQTLQYRICLHSGKHKQTPTATTNLYRNRKKTNGDAEKKKTVMRICGQHVVPKMGSFSGPQSGRRRRGAHCAYPICAVHFLGRKTAKKPEPRFQDKHN